MKVQGPEFIYNKQKRKTQHYQEKTTNINLSEKGAQAQDTWRLQENEACPGEAADCETFSH